MYYINNITENSETGFLDENLVFNPVIKKLLLVIYEIANNLTYCTSFLGTNLSHSLADKKRLTASKTLSPSQQNSSKTTRGTPFLQLDNTFKLFESGFFGLCKDYTSEFGWGTGISCTTLRNLIGPFYLFMLEMEKKNLLQGRDKDNIQ